MKSIQTNNQNLKNGDSVKTKFIDLKGQNILKAEDDDDEGLVSFVDSLIAVDQSSPDGKLNRTTIGDNNGGRIILNEDNNNIVKK